MEVKIVCGDILATKSEAIIIGINSIGPWVGTVFQRLNWATSNHFVNQLADAIDLLEDQETLFAAGPEKNDNVFENVIFVIDNLVSELHEIILAGLKEAETHCLSNVALPLIRAGVNFGVKEKNMDEIIKGMVKAIGLFEKTKPNYIKSITFVIYKNEDLYQMVGAGLFK